MTVAPSPSPQAAPARSASPGEKLRVLVITEDDPLYVINFFDVFFAELPRDRIELLGVTVDAAFHESKIKTAQRIHRFYGTVDFVKLLARFAKVKLTGRSIGKLARKSGIPVIECASVNDPAYVERVKAMKPDVIVSVAAPEIFKTGILGAARLGCINIHSGRLPIYRGMMPTFWQLLEGEKHVTVTVHEMAAKLDAGGVIQTLEFPLRDKDVLDRVITETKREGARLMIRALLSLADGTAQVTPLDMSGAKYFSFPKPPDVARFRARGHRML
jgi:methionyl-tRNA formyltransferase